MAIIRRLDPSHLALYRDLMLEAFARVPEAFTSTVEERAALPESWWAARLSVDAAPDEIVFGALVDGALAGAVGLSFEKRSKTAHKATLFGMYVRPESRRLGLGRALVEAALATARERDRLVVGLTVSGGNQKARRLYETCGFMAWGEEPLAMIQTGAFLSKVHMLCDLRVRTRFQSGG
jgi:GNAT superfamily N-acetyltransferase